jgi:hypothetical protein
MTAFVAGLLLSLAQAFPTVFTWIADAIKGGGALPDRAEVEARITAIGTASPVMDAEEDAAAKVGP